MSPSTPETLAIREAANSRKIVRAYLAGEFITELAAQWGVSYGAMRDRLLDAGVTLRNRGVRLTAAEEEVLMAEFTRLYVADRLSLRGVASATGEPVRRVSRLLKANGVTMRGRGGTRGAK